MPANEHRHWRFGPALAVVVLAATTATAWGTLQPTPTSSTILQEPVPTVTATPPPSVVIEAPATTRDRTTLVGVRLTGLPSRGGSLLYLRIGHRRLMLDGRGDRFNVRVAIAPGRSEIGARVEFFGRGESTPRAKATAPPVRVRRLPGRETGRLDRATALWIAERQRLLYWLCGESDDCLASPSCTRVSARRVDCPVKFRFEHDDPVGCGLVVSTQLRGRRLYVENYGCRGRWVRDLRTFIRPELRAERRYRTDDSFDELGDRNRYGIPRIDAQRDEFIP